MSDNLACERIGTINKNRLGSLMEVIKYNSNKDVTVKFIKTGNTKNTNWYEFINGSVKNVYDKTVFSIGYIGEGKYKPKINKKDTTQYKFWQSMLGRCYGKNIKPAYIDVQVTPEWHCFNTFAKWFDENFYSIPGKQMQLDKDILVKNNKIYSPETCVFVPSDINYLFIKRYSQRGNFPIGVCLIKSCKEKRYMSSCNRVVFGNFPTPEEAFFAYKEGKEKIIKQTANEYKENIPKKLYEAMIKYEVEITD